MQASRASLGTGRQAVGALLLPLLTLLFLLSPQPAAAQQTVSILPAEVTGGDSDETEMSFELYFTGTGSAEVHWITRDISNGAKAGEDYVAVTIEDSGMLRVRDNEQVVVIVKRGVEYLKTVQAQSAEAVRGKVLAEEKAAAKPASP